MWGDRNLYHKRNKYNSKFHGKGRHAAKQLL